MTYLQLNNQYTHNDIWGKYLLYHLSNHPDVKTEILKYPLPVLVGGRRGHNNHIPFIYNDIIFVIDDWDHASPTCYLLNNPNIPKFYLENNVCILKIQYCLHEENNYKEIYKQTNIKIVPFTMFSNHNFILANFQYDINYNHKYDYIITGKPWKHRLPWIRFAAQNKAAGSNNANLYFGREENSTDNFLFYEQLKESRWGLILKGKGCGGKNRREVEFTSLGMPLVLNYIPNYPFDFIPNKDFVFLRSPEDLISLKDIDPVPFAERSKYIYSKYFSPEFGVYNSFQMAYKQAKHENLIFSTRTETPDEYLRKSNTDIVEIIPNQGHHIKSLAFGNTVSIQYAYGAWKSWGPGRRSLVNPDNTNGRGGDRARLGIFRITPSEKTLLQIVPEHTNEKPFIFNIIDNDLNICLDICDQNSRAKGVVAYTIRVFKK